MARPLFFDRAKLLQQLKQGVAELPLKLDERQIAHLLDYLGLLVKWNATYNLTAVRDPEQMVVQHLLDTLAVVPAFEGAQNVLDVGAGGGLPGLVLAICGVPAVAMIDIVHKKTAFLTQVKAELGLHNATVYTGRVEQLSVESGAGPFDVITSRAFAELNDFVTWSGHLLAPGGKFIALKGVEPLEEVARLHEVAEGWKVTEIRKLAVPGMQAERHLVFIGKTATDN
jgi:16S rRNA (guanine527-N7)-methyltransferase